MVSKINRPSWVTTIVVVLIGLYFIILGLTNFQSPDLFFTLGGVLLIAYVLYRKRYPKEISPSSFSVLQGIETGMAEMKKSAIEDKKEAEKQEIPLKEYVTKKYAFSDARDKVKVGSLGSLLLGLLLSILFIGLGVYQAKKEWRVSHQFLETTCTIQDKKMSSYRSTNKIEYQVQFYVAYRANHEMITEWASLTPTTGTNTNSFFARLGTGKFTVGQSYPCWYDPNNIKSVALERGYSWFVIFFLGISSAVFILLSWVIIKYKLINRTRQ